MIIAIVSLQKYVEFMANKEAHIANYVGTMKENRF
jgi:hypothetical protein